jgi:hypothetical protein
MSKANRCCWIISGGYSNLLCDNLLLDSIASGKDDVLNIGKLIVLVGLLVSGTLTASNQIEVTRQEIDHLLNFVANTDCQYDRNGTIHNGPEARDHINRKYEYYRRKVVTAEDFIKYSATKSKISGRKYKIRCAGAKEKDASDWLLEELQVFRESQLN